MYIVSKERGRNQLVFLENADTEQSVCLGKLSSEIMSIMGYDFTSDPDTYSLNANEVWNREITEDIAKELSALTLPSHKPNRIKTMPVKPKVNAKPNGLDVLFGRADY